MINEKPEIIKRWVALLDLRLKTTTTGTRRFTIASINKLKDVKFAKEKHGFTNKQVLSYLVGISEKE